MTNPTAENGITIQTDESIEITTQNMQVSESTLVPATDTAPAEGIKYPDPTSRATDIVSAVPINVPAGISDTSSSIVNATTTDIGLGTIDSQSSTTPIEEGAQGLVDSSATAPAAALPVIPGVPSTSKGIGAVDPVRQQRPPRQEQPRNPQAAKKPAPAPEVMEINSPLGYKKDGHDHINIGTGAQSPLGRRLSQNYAALFVSSDAGPFLTITGYWFYLLSEDHDDQFRDKRHDAVRRLADKKHLLSKLSGFQEKIARAYWDKINQLPGLRDEVAACELPFEAYYIYGEADPRFPNAQHSIAERSAKWLVPFFDEMRTAIRENREPNYACVQDSLEQHRRQPSRGRGESNDRPVTGDQRRANQSQRQARDTWTAAGLDRVRALVPRDDQRQGQPKRRR